MPDRDTDAVRDDIEKFRSGEYEYEGRTLDPNDPEDRQIFAEEIVGDFMWDVISEVNSGAITESEARELLKTGIGSDTEAISLMVDFLERVREPTPENAAYIEVIWPKLAKRFEARGETTDHGTDEDKRTQIDSGKGDTPEEGDHSVEDAQRTTESRETGGETDPTARTSAGDGGSGPDSGGDGTASSAKEDSKSGGDPILLASGQFQNRTTDLSADGRGLSFSFVRTYLNGATYEGPLGHNWDHSYNLWLREERHRDANGTPKNVVYRSTGTLREDPYVQRIDEPTGGLEPLDQWQDATFDSPPGYFDRLEKSGGTYVLETVNGLQYRYNDDNYIERIVDPNDNEMRFKYDDRNRLVSVFDPVGKEFQFEYDARNRIEWLIDVAGGRRVHYLYGDNGDLIEVDKHFDDRIVSTDYRYTGPDRPRELQHNLEEVINGAGETIHENEYGSESGSRAYNRVVRQWSRDGEFRYEYDPVEESEVDPVNAARQATTVTYPNGHTVTHQFNRQQNVVRRRERIRTELGDFDTLESTYRYDEDGQLVEETVADGSRTEYVYGRQLYAETHGGTVDGATPAEELTFGNLRSVIRHPRPGVDESRLIVTDYEYQDRSAVSGERLQSVHGPYYADQQGTELPDQAVGTTTFEYDGDGNLLEVQPPDVEQPDGTVVTPTPRTFEYDGHGQVTDAHVEGVHTQFEYFDDRRRSGFLERILDDPDGAALETTFSVDDLGRVTQTVGPYGATTDIEWTNFDERRSVTQPAVGSSGNRPTVSFEYDDAGRRVRSTTELLDHDGSEHPDGPLVRTFDYDRFGRETERTRGPESTPRTHVRTKAFDRTGQLRRRTDWRGAVTRLEYDQRQRVDHEVRAVGTDAEATIQREYNRVGREVATTDERGETTKRTYDAFGRLSRIERPDGTERRFEYDAAGRRVRERLLGEPPDSDDTVTWAESTTEYDAFGRAIREHAHLFDPTSGGGSHRKLTTESFFNADGRLVESVDPTGASTTYAYDDLNRRIDVRDPDGTVVTTEYDDANRTVERTVERTGTGPDGSQTTHVSRTVRRLDEQGRTVERIDVAGNERTWDYDSRGNQVREVDPTGTEYRTEYDVFGHKVSDEDGGARSTYDRDESGDVLGVTDPLGNTTTVGRDALGRVTRVTRGSVTHQYEYDAAGNRIRIEDENGAVRHRTFDPVGRLLVEMVDVSDVDSPSARLNYTPTTRGRREFTYTPAGDVARARNDDATVEREYDSLGRLVADSTDGRRVELTYDDTDRLEAVTFPNGRRIEYGYSAGGTLESIEQTDDGSGYPGDASTAATRRLLSTDHVGDRITGMDLDAVSASVTHDTRGLPVGADWETDDGPLSSERRLYDPRDACRLVQFDGDRRLHEIDARGRLTGTTVDKGADTIDVSELAPPESASEIDMAGQQRETNLLPDASGSPDTDLDYDLDDNSNRQQVTETADGSTMSTDYDVGAFNQYDSVGGETQIHDRAGNLLSDGSRSLEYDVHDRLASVSSPSGAALTIQRGPLGRLIGVDDGSRSRVFSYAGEQLVGWRAAGASDASGHLVHARSGVCHAATGGTDYVPVTNLDGSVRRWLDAANPGDSGDPQRRYGPFGQVWEDQGTWPAPVGYRGYVEPGTNELLGLRARTYAPEQGRFLQRDPAEFADGPNQYTYARHAPVALTDRFGFQSSDPAHGTPADSSARGEPKDEWNPWRSGGTALAIGGVGLLTGAAVLASGGSIGIVGGVIATKGLGTGFAGVGIGLSQIATSGAINDRQEKRMNRSIQTALGFTGSPGAMVGGMAGLAYTGDESGLRQGSFYGGLTEAGVQLGYGGYRLLREEMIFEKTYKGSKYYWSEFDPPRFWEEDVIPVKPSIRQAKGLDKVDEAATRAASFRHIDAPEKLELSHLVPQRWYEESKLGRMAFNRPWNVRPMWKSEHIRVDFFSRMQGIPADETLPHGLRQWRRTPENMQIIGIGGVKLVSRFGFALEDDPKQ